MAPRSNPGFLQVGRRRDNIIYFSQKGTMKREGGNRKGGSHIKDRGIKKKKKEESLKGSSGHMSEASGAKTPGRA